MAIISSYIKLLKQRAVFGNHVVKRAGFQKNWLVAYKWACRQIVVGDQDQLLSNHAEVLDCHFFGGISTARVLC